ncbi:MAG: SusE domain-containing protein [Bacteroidota bacterium]
MFKQHILFAFAAILLCFTACEEQVFDPVLVLGNAASISAPADGTSIVIEEGTEGDEFATFTWSAADFGFAAGVSYSVEVDLAGNNFAEAEAIVPAVNATQALVKNGEVNNFLIGRDVAGGTEQAMETRIKAVVGREEDGNVLYSDVVTLNVTPFEAERVYPGLYVPGAHQGWDPATAPQIYDISDPPNGIYDGYIFFADASNEFKFTDAPNWDNGNFGDNDGDGNIDDGGDNIVGTDAGLYRLTVNINDKTYTSELTNWGVIGSATPTGWDSDTDMVYDAGTGILSVTLDLVGGDDSAIKFRANDDWATNLGDTGADGTMEYGGDNIAVAESGNYTIELMLGQPIFAYKLTKN